MNIVIPNSSSNLRVIRVYRQCVIFFRCWRIGAGTNRELDTQKTHKYLWKTQIFHLQTLKYQLLRTCNGLLNIYF